jgi:hypothetical protein
MGELVGELLRVRMCKRVRKKIAREIGVVE